MVHIDYSLKSYGIWMMEGELEVHMDRMDQTDRLPAAAGRGHAGELLQCCYALRTRPPCALMASSSRNPQLVDHQLIA